MKRGRHVLKVSAADFQRNIGRYQDLALREPVAVTRNGRESCVLLSVDEYRRLKRRDRRVRLVEELSDEEIALIAKAEVPAGYEHLDEELKDWNP
nr:type II toxin-antitoxin system prevent-host-death family antitoxin [Methylosinus sp. Sm6]